MSRSGVAKRKVEEMKRLNFRKEVVIVNKLIL
jgi:hypothetical protein